LRKGNEIKMIKKKSKEKGKKKKNKGKKWGKIGIPTQLNVRLG
jgi:hypothetical protein